MMEGVIVNKPDHLARKVIEDIRARGLNPGDQYLTSEEARELFRARKSHINQAMKMLADKNILVRQRKSGTFVGPAYKEDALAGVSGLRVVHVMMATDFYRTQTIPTNLCIDTISQTLPGVSVQIHVIPDQNSTRHIQAAIDGIPQEERKAHGLILIRSSRDAQRLVEDSGIPAVVSGSVYPDVKQLSWVDVDQEAAGRVSTAYAIEKGYRHFILLMRNEWRRGDNLVLKGVSAALGEAGLGADAMQVLSIPPQEDVIREEMKYHLDGSDRRLAILCRGGFFVDPTFRVLQTLNGDNIDRHLVINLQKLNESHQSCPTIQPRLGPREHIIELVRILAEISDVHSGRREICIPVELVEP